MNIVFRILTLASLGFAVIGCISLGWLAIFVGGMSVGIGPGIPFLSILIMLAPIIGVVILIIIGIWLEYHKSAYLYVGPVVIVVLAAIASRAGVPGFKEFGQFVVYWSNRPLW